MSFSNLGLCKELLRAIKEEGYTIATPIQAKAIPVILSKKDVLAAAQTGTGKTLVAKTIAKMLDVPLAIVDATVLTEAGYVGEDVESILTRLLQAADYDVTKAEQIGRAHV